jgi:uncharacterized membrane protein SpoIIM required for sporulation
VSTDPLERLTREVRFARERIIVHILPGIFLSVSAFAIASLTYSILETGGLNPGNFWIARLASLYIGYILASAYSAYRLFSILSRHLVDSGLVSYRAARDRGDKDAILILYRGGILKKNLPSPTTALILTLGTLGIAYPFLLYVYEKNLREHAYGEEKIFLGEPGVNRTSVEHFLIDIAATLLTLGLYMVYWGYRAPTVYNRHIGRMHSSGSGPVITQTYTPRTIESPVFILTGSLLVGVGLTGFLGAFGVKVNLLLGLGMGFAAAYASLRLRWRSVAAHVFGLLGLIYLFFALGSIAGFIGAPGYIDFIQNTQQQMQEIMSSDPLVLARNIYFNNLVIAGVESVPIMGLILLGIGVSNASIFYGAFLNQSILLHGNPSPLLLFIMPHTFLELLSYAIMAAGSIRLAYDRERKAAILLIAGIITLLIAAFVESYTIVLSR